MLDTVAANDSVTAMLSRVNAKEPEALEDLTPFVYRDLHRIAEGCLRRESPDNTLQATALIHELYLRLLNTHSPRYQNRGHFFALAARSMRRIVVDHARARHTKKRGDGVKIALEPHIDVAPERERGVVELDHALSSLEKTHESLARLVEMKYFAGMTAEEISECTEIPVPVVRRQLRAAQAWLRREMQA